MSQETCKVTWCTAVAGASGACGPHTQWPPLEKESPEAWTSRAGRLHRALKRLLQHAEIVAGVLDETPKAKWEIVRATKLTSHYVNRALRHLQEKGLVTREGKHAGTKYRKPAKVAA